MSKPSSDSADHVPGTRPGATQIRRGAKALVTSASNVLLVKERHADGTPFWTLPGGGVDPGESPEEGLHRELDEELRCRGRIGRPVTQFWYAHDSLDNTVSAYTVYDCTLLTDPSPVHDEGIYDARWATPSALPSATLPQVRQVCQHATDLPAASVLADD
ncbi:NUDIX hydrolase [Haloarcula marina]|uniref:NUDIX hydrolase n=1 Tax=Haloarcula marina TaxID=2961574 RepID=UPI0020B83AF4|nr:NUDIX hydrolase [Halomicroarcula marina]